MQTDHQNDILYSHIAGVILFVAKKISNHTVKSMRSKFCQNSAFFKKRAQTNTKLSLKVPDSLSFFTVRKPWE